MIVGFIFLALLWYGLGAGITSLLNIRMRSFLEDALTKMCLGAAVFVPLLFVFEIAHIPIHWAIFLGVGLAGAVWSILKESALPWWEKHDWYLLGAVAVCVAVASLMIAGAHSYPYLEDDDPWEHATGTLYVSQEFTSFQSPDNIWGRYIAPYPPYYDALMGLTVQVTHDVPRTLKNLNGLLVGFMLLPAFLFFRRFIEDDVAALIVVGILGLLPSFASHFIWAQTLGLFLLFVSLLSLAHARSHASWFWLAIISVFAAVVTQPSSGFKNGLFVLTFWVALIIHGALNGKKIFTPATKRVLLVGVISVGLIIVHWAILFGLYGSSVGELIGFNFDLSKGDQGFGIGDTSGGVTYGWNDFWQAPKSSKIDQATGIGSVLVILVLIGIIFTILKWNAIKKREWAILALTWLILGIIYIHGNRYPKHLLFVHRYWPWLGIAVAMVAALAIIMILNSTSNVPVKIGILVVIAALIWITSGTAKVAVQTAGWPPGVHWANPQAEIPGYVAMQDQLPTGTRVWNLCGHPKRVIGFGMTSEPWDATQQEFRKKGAAISAEELIAFLQTHGFSHIILDVSCVRDYGANETSELADRLTQAQRFRPVLQQQGFLLAQLI